MIPDRLFLANKSPGLKLIDVSYNKILDKQVVVCSLRMVRAVYLHANLPDLSCISGYFGDEFIIVEAYRDAFAKMRAPCTLYEIAAKGFDVFPGTKEEFYCPNPVEATKETPIANMYDYLVKHTRFVPHAGIGHINAHQLTDINKSASEYTVAIVHPNFAIIDPDLPQQVVFYLEGSRVWEVPTVPSVFNWVGSSNPAIVLIADGVVTFNGDLSDKEPKREPIQPLLRSNTLSLDISSVQYKVAKKYNATVKDEMEALATAVLKLCILHGTGFPVQVCAHGHHHILATAMAATHPDKVTGLIFLEPQGDYSIASYTKKPDPGNKIAEHKYKNLFMEYEPPKSLSTPLMIIDGHQFDMAPCKNIKEVFTNVQVEDMASFVDVHHQYPIPVSNCINRFVASINNL